MDVASDRRLQMICSVTCAAEAQVVQNLFVRGSCININHTCGEFIFPSAFVYDLWRSCGVIRCPARGRCYTNHFWWINQYVYIFFLYILVFTVLLEISRSHSFCWCCSVLLIN